MHGSYFTENNIGGHITNINTSDYKIEYEYDLTGNCVSTSFYNKLGDLTKFERYDIDENGVLMGSVDSNGNAFTYKHFYDSFGNRTRQELYNADGELTESTILEYTAITVPSDSDATTQMPNYRDLCDYLLCYGSDGFKLVAKQIETFADVWVEVGALDRDNNWILPLSRNTIINPNGELIGSEDFYSFSQNCEKLSERLYYAGEGAIFDSQKRQMYFFPSEYCVETGRICTVDYFDDYDGLKFRDGYIVAANDDFGMDTVKIISNQGSVIDTNIYCGSAKHLGIYSEGLFFSYDGFYDISGNKVIDLSEFAEQIVNRPFFVDGKCYLYAKNAAGSEYEAIIDLAGNFIQEFTKL